MLQLEVLVSELLAEDGLAAGAIVVGEVAALAHELRDDAVERAVLETEALLSSTQSAEILGCLRYNVSTQFQGYATERLPVGGHVEEYLKQANIDINLYKSCQLMKSANSGASWKQLDNF